MPIRKRVIDAGGSSTASWLAVEQLARVEVTSEDPGWPIDAALTDDLGAGWRASRPGDQRIRIVFDRPQTLTLVHLAFEEREMERVQEFSLRCSSDGGATQQTIVRQQFTFSPSGAVREVEDYKVALDGVTELELHIIPDISGRPVVATLKQFRFR